MTRNVNFIELITHGRIPEVLVGTWVVMGILLVFAFAARRALERAADAIRPDEGLSLRSLAEVLVEQIDNFVHGVMATHEYRKLVPFLGSLFLFILAANFFGLIPGMEPPTANSDLTFALGTVAFCYFIYQGFAANGVGYLRNFLGPLLPLAPLMLPIELADHLFRPFSLGVRLYANMFADHHVLSIFTGLTKLVVPLAFYALGAIVCVIQALIFMVLTMSYIKLAQAHDH
ncbi:MAG TPA: F0F1 ATP synthase subunit A [Candidatus Binataceae bacterium]|nr:F0F1 ATP synthase subunit A [Candidatus Binataceae bacterium]